MANKETGVPCYDKAHPNEPLFVLRGQDIYAAEVIRYWANLMNGGIVCSFELKPRNEMHPKARSAMEVADAMEAWAGKKMPD